MFNYVSMDAEFNRSSDSVMNVVCVAVDGKVFWTNGHKGKDLAQYFQELPPDTILLSFSAEAEASSLLSLGIDPLKFKWIDLQLEVKMLYNHCHEVMKGNHLQKGREITIRPKQNKYGQIIMEKPSTSLASSLFHFLKIKIDTIQVSIRQIALFIIKFYYFF